MSTTALSAVFALGPEVSGTDRLVLLVLADYASAEGYAYPKVATIAKRIGSNREETVRKALRKLEAAGYITRNVRGWAGVDGSIPKDVRPNLYQLTPLVLAATTPHKAGSPDARFAGSPDSPLSGETRTVSRNRQENQPPPTPPVGGRTDGIVGEQTTLPIAEEPQQRRERQRCDPFKGNDLMDAAFRRWWEQYPRKTAKDKARQAYANAVTDGISTSTLATALGYYIRSLNTYREACKGRADAPVMLPATWLNGGWRRWEDGEDSDCWPRPGQVEYHPTEPETTEVRRARFLADMARQEAQA